MSTANTPKNNPLTVKPDPRFSSLLLKALKPSKSGGDDDLQALFSYVEQQYESSASDNTLLAQYAILTIEQIGKYLAKKKHTAKNSVLALFSLMVNLPIEPDTPAFVPIREYFGDSCDTEIQIAHFIKLQTIIILVNNQDTENASSFSKEIEQSFLGEVSCTAKVYSLLKANVLNQQKDYLAEFILRIRLLETGIKDGDIDFCVYSLCEWTKALYWLRNTELRKDLLQTLLGDNETRHPMIVTKLLYELFSLDDRIVKPSEKMHYVKKLMKQCATMLSVQQLQAIYFFAGNYSSGMQSRVRESIVYFQYSNYYIYKTWQYLKKITAYLRQQLSVSQFVHAINFVEDRLQEFSNQISLQNNAYVETLQAGYTKIEELYREVEELSLTDSLTGLNNRRFLENNLYQMVILTLRHNAPVSFAMIDIDLFKRVNDEYGHLAGDYILKEIARIIKTQFRKSDIVIRYGGEEFFVALFDSSESSVRENMESLRDEVENHRFFYRNQPIPITISIGITFIEPDDTVEPNLNKIISDADSALYRAKNGGRNQICIQK